MTVAESRSGAVVIRAATMLGAERAAPIGHYIMFRDNGRYEADWCVMSPEERDRTPLREPGGIMGWQTWCRKEAPQS